MNELVKSLVEIGFSQEEAEKQLRELNDIVIAKVANQLLGDDISPNLSEADVKALIEQRYTPQQFKDIFDQISGGVVKGYLDAVSANLDVERKNRFYLQVFSSVPQMNSNQPA